MALALPLFSLIADNATFLVAHDANSIDILLLTALVSFVIPGALFLSVVVLRYFSEEFAQFLFICLLFSLGTLVILPVVNSLADLHPLMHLSLAAILAWIGLITYIRLAVIRNYLSIVGMVGLSIPVWFLFGTQVSALLFDTWSANEPRIEASTNNGTPLVFIIFDELPLTSLMNTAREIDSKKFPNFAGLADSSHWFRNTSAVTYLTEIAVPAMLTGEYPEFSITADGSMSAPLPTAKFYPNNLFSLLDNTHVIRAFESISNINVGENSDQRATDEAVIGDYVVLWLDSAIAWLNITIPPNLLPSLPDTEGRWRDFAGITENNNRPVDDFPFPYREARLNKVADFIDSVTDRRSPYVYYLHTVLPHSPFVFLPSGKYYGQQSQLPHGMNPDWWDADSWEALQGYQRHLLQLGFVDGLLGKIIDKLRQENVFDQSLVIVAGDHGESFRERTRPRAFSLDNASDTVLVPLFVKLPQQTEGVVNDRVAETVDILPTIAAILETEIPWDVDGINLFDENDQRDERRVVFHTGAIETYPASIPGINESLSRKSAFFGDEGLDHLFRIGSHPELLEMEVKALTISSERARQVNIENFFAFNFVDHASGFLPAHIKGSFIDELESQTLAIAVNGRIVAITETYSEAGRGGFFTAMLPEASLRDGANSVNIFLILDEDEDLVLRRTYVTSKQLTLPLNTRLSFTADEYQEQYVLGGLGSPEQTLTWSVGNTVNFGIAIASFEESLFMDLEVFPFVSENLVPKQNVLVSINGEILEKWVFESSAVSRRRLIIPAGTINPEETFVLSFQLPDAVTPVSLGINADSRQLGLGFISMVFSEPLHGDEDQRTQMKTQ